MGAYQTSSLEKTAAECFFWSQPENFNNFDNQTELNSTCDNLVLSNDPVIQVVILEAMSLRKYSSPHIGFISSLLASKKKGVIIKHNTFEAIGEKTVALAAYEYLQSVLMVRETNAFQAIEKLYHENQDWIYSQADDNPNDMILQGVCQVFGMPILTAKEKIALEQFNLRKEMAVRLFKRYISNDFEKQSAQSLLTLKRILQFVFHEVTDIKIFTKTISTLN